MRAPARMGGAVEESSVAAVLGAVCLLALMGGVTVFSATNTPADATFSPYFLRHACGLEIGRASCRERVYVLV